MPHKLQRVARAETDRLLHLSALRLGHLGFLDFHVAIGQNAEMPRCLPGALGVALAQHAIDNNAERGRRRFPGFIRHRMHRALRFRGRYARAPSSR